MGTLVLRVPLGRPDHKAPLVMPVPLVFLDHLAHLDPKEKPATQVLWDHPEWMARWETTVKRDSAACVERPASPATLVRLAQEERSVHKDEQDPSAQLVQRANPENWDPREVKDPEVPVDVKVCLALPVRPVRPDPLAHVETLVQQALTVSAVSWDRLALKVRPGLLERSVHKVPLACLDNRVLEEEGALVDPKASAVPLESGETPASPASAVSRVFQENLGSLDRRVSAVIRVLLVKLVQLATWVCLDLLVTPASWVFPVDRVPSVDKDSRDPPVQRVKPDLKAPLETVGLLALRDPLALLACAVMKVSQVKMVQLAHRVPLVLLENSTPLSRRSSVAQTVVVPMTTW